MDSLLGLRQSIPVRHQACNLGWIKWNKIVLKKNPELNPITIKVYKDIDVWQEDKTVGITGFRYLSRGHH